MPYLEQHVYPVALELSLSGQDAEDGIVVALLHDVLEDCHTIDRDDLEAIFGEHIANAVLTLTKPWARERELEPATDRERERREAAYFAAIQGAPELVQRVKVFDRLNNLACVHEKPRAEQLEYTRETERFHLPLARQIDPALARRMDALLASLR
jgi:(p)ppGpp synthase/HD superfamily hydrolase